MPAQNDRRPTQQSGFSPLSDSNEAALILRSKCLTIMLMSRVGLESCLEVVGMIGGQAVSAAVLAPSVRVSPRCSYESPACAFCSHDSKPSSRPVALVTTLCRMMLLLMLTRACKH